MKRCAGETDEHRLVYRERFRWYIGIPLLILGLGLLAGNGKDLARHWTDWDGLLFGLILGAILVKGGTLLIASRRLVFDKAEQHLVDTRRFLFFTRLERWILSDFDAVAWERHENSDGDSTTIAFPVLLRTGHHELELHKASRADDARSLTREIGEFLGIAQSHGDAEARDRSSPTARELRRAQASVARLGIYSSISTKVTGAGSRLVIRKTMPGNSRTFWRFFGVVAVFMGASFVLSTFTGGTFNGRKDAFWEPLAIGASLLIGGVVILLGRRGITIDKQEQIVRFWWGLPDPVWSRRHDLSRFSKVGFDESLLQSALIFGRAVLKGESLPDLVLHRSKDLEVTRSLAASVAQFLGWSLAAESHAPHSETIQSQS
jgi:hypothetical protein